ncbi:acyltransferase [Seohaeicola saemankumensis]|nr:acyltransferase [Seohaeicola saemankumensis]MCA0873472.1 acyltransferase [Seohaeicola saemankumensis]
MDFDIADLVSGPTPLENCVVHCSEAVLKRLRFAVHGRADLPRRNYRVSIPDPEFRGKVSILMGPGSGEIELGGRGPMVADFRMWRDATVRIGEKTTINGARIVADNADIVIGRDNLWSDEIIVQSNDQHGIVDLKTGQVKNTHRRRTRIGDHVWVGRRTVLMPDLVVGDGAVVAAGAIVTREVPPRCIAGGNPARVISEDTSWSRQPGGPSPAETGYYGEDWPG